jgi:tetrahydromethanopterin S-methyltransferase subunit A
MSAANEGSISEALAPLQEAAAHEKCWSCGCFQKSLVVFERAYPKDQRPPDLAAVISQARPRLLAARYDCLGCEICFPALAINVLADVTGEDALVCEVCPAEKVEKRQGWPPLAGAYTVLRYRAPVAVCTLTDEKLMAAVKEMVGPEISIVGTLFTENLGIERLIQNIIANPHIRFLIVCGPDSHQAVGHLPGQSLVALVQSGMDERARILGALGKRPTLKNIGREAVEHFRESVEVLDLIGVNAASEIIATAINCLARNPGPAAAFQSERLLIPISGYLLERMIPDPAGYFVIFVDRMRQLISLEHYQNHGVLDTVIEGKTAPEIYLPAIDKGLVSRLDHSAYLGRELARAEQALSSGESYRQDGAPEILAPPAMVKCACGSSCDEGSS